MRKFSLTLLVLIIILAAIALALPYYFSSRGETDLRQLLHAYQAAHPNTQFTLTDYQRKGTQATAVIAVDNPKAKVHTNILANLNFGPFMYIKTLEGKKRFEVGRAFINYHVNLNDTLHQTIPVTLTDPTIEGTALITLSGNYKNRSQIAKANIQKYLPEGFAGISSQEFLTKNARSISGRLKAAKLMIKDDDSQLNISPWEITYNAKRYYDYLWVGDTLINIPKIEATFPGNLEQPNAKQEKITLQNISLKSDTHVSKDKLNGTFNLGVNKILSQAIEGNYQFSLQFAQLNAHAANNLIKNAIKPQGDSDLLADSINLLNPDSQFKIKSIFNNTREHSSVISQTELFSQANNVNFVVDIDGNRLNINNNHIFAKFNLKLANINKDSYARLLQILQSPTTESPGPVLPRMLNSINVLPQLIQPETHLHANLKLATDNYGPFDLLAINVTFPNINVNPNIVQVLQSLKITTHWQMPQTLTNQLLKLDPQTLLKLYPDLNDYGDFVTDFENLKLDFPALVQQGYITEQNGFYQTKITFEHGQLLVNGKVFHPENLPSQQIQQPQTPA